MKKLLLTLGAVASVAAPVAAVVACSNDTVDPTALGTLSLDDLSKNFSKTPNDLETIAAKLAAKVFTDGVEKITFKFNGKEYTFNFGTDVFYHDGNKNAVAGETATIGSGGDVDAVSGVDADYIGGTVKLLQLKGNKLYAADTVTSADDINFIHDVKYLIRMAVGAKTELHYIPNSEWTTTV